MRRRVVTTLERRMPTTDDYLEQIALTAEPTPRSEGGLRVSVTISLYKRGHAGLDTKGVSGIPMNDDHELSRSLATVIAKMRDRM
jgi:hypothetical protein